MNLIEHVIEPQKLLLAWQSLEPEYRDRHIVAELIRTSSEDANLIYLVNTTSFEKAKNRGFKGYPAFSYLKNIYYDNVLDTFRVRLVSKNRDDYKNYLDELRLKPDVPISDFGLLGYSNGRLLSDGFSFIHPFENVSGPCELFIEAAGFRHIYEGTNPVNIQIGDKVYFKITKYENEDAIEILDQSNKLLGYINRGLINTFIDWINNKRIVTASIEKINLSFENRRSLYIFVKIKSKTIS